MKKIFLLILLWVLPAYSQEYTENNTSYDINWADVNAKNNDGETALITASKLNDFFYLCVITSPPYRALVGGDKSTPPVVTLLLKFIDRLYRTTDYH